MKFHFHPQADDEFDKAVQYYENCRLGLGLEFAEEVYATVARISEYPRHGRRCQSTRGVAS